MTANGLRRLLIPGRLSEALRDSLWVAPVACVAGALGLAFATLAIDRGADTSFAYIGSASSARSLLSTLASAMLSFTGLVFTITIVALQLASSQWSPRVMRTFLRDRSAKLALGTFVATFTYAFVVLRGISDTFIPGVSLTVAIVLMLVSVGTFIHYINHIAHSLRVSSVIAAVGDEGRAVVERLMPAEPEGPPPAAPRLSAEPTVLANAHGPGTLVAYDETGLVRCGEEADCVIELAAAVGTFVAQGAALLRMHGDRSPASDPRELLQLARERTAQQDAGFALRQLADIAIRALSPSVNDPTTAVQAIDRLYDLLRMIGTRPIPDGRAADAAGRTRLLVPALPWEGYVGLAVDEIMLLAGEQPQVRRRLSTAFDDLLAAVPPERRPPLAERREQLTRRSR
jgi:uncharacterized membrane protein